MEPTKKNILFATIGIVILAFIIQLLYQKGDHSLPDHIDSIDRPESVSKKDLKEESSVPELKGNGLDGMPGQIEEEDEPDPEFPEPPSFSRLQLFKKYAVCADSTECSLVGSEIIDQGGNVIDSAIATMLCNSLVTPQSMGLGGGFIINIYKDKKFYTLNAKEVAPLAATPDMFKTRDEYQLGALSIAVPGEVKGYSELYKRFGSLPWKSLVEPTIKICEDGFILTEHMFDSIEPYHYDDPHMRKTFFINGRNETRQPGDLIKMPAELCHTYRLIADYGGDDFYNGTLADLILDDLKEIGSIIKKEDLQLYKPRWEETLSVPIRGSSINVIPSAGGPLVAFILNVLSGYNMNKTSIETEDEQIQTYHRFIESFKYAFGLRTHLKESGIPSSLIEEMLTPEFGEKIRARINEDKTFNDPEHYFGNFITVDHGTGHTSILAPNGDAVSVTSSTNLYFGIGKTGKRTGFIFNNGLNDFAVTNMPNYEETQPSPNNFIEPHIPHQRAISSFSPTIVTDANGDVQLVIGSSGGPKIITATAMIIARVLWFNQTIKEAIDEARIHHQLLPMHIEYQHGNTKKVVAGLQDLGHKMKVYYYRGSVVRAIEKNQYGILANSDWRKESLAIGV
ncbi:glutathione hydrolase 1 proenzyme-like [Contarinia nasturtii]|uniref:glutathione hydrolase 1 proenzyme-like n=1 Tax=Contarinia nasturtii TaxID=265458 RepID=UPI0012D3780B|nr:glutathione hydrolase 1 proenzyme-like [Contarinia nasturtii]